MVGRVLLLIAAFVVAGLGALLVYLYADQADERALNELSPVSVYVVQTELPSNTLISTAVAEELILIEGVPGEAVPEGAVTEDVPLDGLVALTELVPGEVLVDARIGDPANLDRLPIPEDRIAVSFPFNDPNRVADFIVPGSEIAVFLTWNATDQDDETGEPAPEDPAAAPGQEADPGSRNTRLLLDRALVLATGATTTTQEGTAEGEEAAVPTSILTLALTQAEAERVILGDDLGDLYLGLLTEDSAVAPSDGADDTNLFSEAGS
jgi:pilus assembly protein CpaB